ncbi:MAG: exodeoxyribonuclease III [Rhodoferax sp.]
MRLATWNVNSLAVRLPQVLDWLAANPVDVLALQELKLTDDKFPHDALAQAGYASVCFGQKTYNGVALISRTPAQDVVRNIPGFEDEMARVISARFAWPHDEKNNSDAGIPDATLRVIGAYFPNGQAPDSDKFVYKLRWLSALHDWVRQELACHPNLVLMGDFNIAPTDADSFDPEGLRGTIHHTEAERAHFQALLDLGLVDAFRMFEQPARAFSWWDYRNLAFRRNQGLRIDHVLVSPALAAHASACTIDKAPRKLERPSDHAPVVLTLS